MWLNQLVRFTHFIFLRYTRQYYVSEFYQFSCQFHPFSVVDSEQPPNYSLVEDSRHSSGTLFVSWIFLYHFDLFSVQFFFGILNPFFLSFFNWIQLALLVFTLLWGSFGFIWFQFLFVSFLTANLHRGLKNCFFFMSRLLLPYSFWTFISLYSLEFLFPFLFGLSFPYSIWTFFFSFFFNSFSILF